MATTIAHGRNWDVDHYGVVVNGPQTYAAIAGMLLDGIPVVTSWGHDGLTMLSLLFTPGARLVAEVQGIHPAAQSPIMGDVTFVSVLRCGAFGFVHDFSSVGLSGDYVGEKLGVGGSTADALADLINGVLQRMRGD